MRRRTRQKGDLLLEALLFDVDGTLADTEELHRQAFNAAFVEHGLEWDWGPAKYAQLLAVAGGKERLARYLDSLVLEEEERERLRARLPEIHRTKTRFYQAFFAAGRCPLRPGVARLIADARAAGLKLAIASTTTASNVEALLDATLGEPPHRLFHALVCGDQVAQKKPAPDAYRLALELLQVHPARALAFEDSPNGVRAAKAAGLAVVVTPTRWNADADFGDADLVRPSLEGLGLSELERIFARRDAVA